MSEGFSRERFVEKVQGLIAKAESTTQEEAEAAMGLARKLMDKYGISTADVEALKADTTAAGDKAYKKGEQVGGTRTQNWDRWEQWLASAVASLTDTIAIQTRPSRWSDNKAKMTFAGDELDVAIAAATFSMLNKSGRTLAKAYAKRMGTPTWTVQRSFLEGFVNGISAKVNEMKSASARQFDGTADAGTFALVQVSKRQWLERVSAELGLRTTKARQSSARTDGNARSTGYAEGRRADLAVTNKLG